MKVEPVNDAPVLRPEFHRALVSDFYSLMSPRTMSILEGADVPFDADTNPNYGFLTNDLARHYFVDPDDGDVELRLAVVIAKADQGIECYAKVTVLYHEKYSLHLHVIIKNLAKIVMVKL